MVKIVLLILGVLISVIGIVNIMGNISTIHSYNLRKGKGSYEDGKAEANTNKIIVGDLQLDVDKFETRVKNKVIDLTLREFEVLKYLANQLGQVVTRETLLEKVWGYEYYGDIRTVDVTVRRIREKIEEDTSNPKILITKRGVGYYIATGDK